MSTVRDLHREAMRLAQESFIERSRENPEGAEDLARRALDLEIQAIEKIPQGKTSEPTLSILYRSAASLAYQSGELEEAQRLAAKGLSGFPPREIQDELNELFEQVKFELTLKSLELKISEDDHPGGRSLHVFDQEWYFSQRALKALEANGPITESTLKNCAINLGLMDETKQEYFELVYFGIPLRGKHIAGMIMIYFGIPLRGKHIAGMIMIDAQKEPKAKEK